MSSKRTLRSSSTPRENELLGKTPNKVPKTSPKKKTIQYVYIVQSISYTDDYKNAETTSEIPGVFEDKEKAFEVATQGQLREVNEIVEYDQEADSEGIEKGIEAIMAMGSWKEKFQATLVLLDENLPEAEFTAYASHTRYKVVEAELNRSSV
ncbi:hypothetical protein BGZ49_005599 [Haplosporangium sp. Z 27]|nr:hypothetical protein BGZ49_005599 [Haplosporangium sp. Z 27]